MCECCRQWFPASKLVTKEGYLYCLDCADELFPDHRPCDLCSFELIDDENSHAVTDNESREVLCICRRCFENETWECTNCGDYFCGHPSMEGGCQRICQRCTDYYCYCAGCGELLPTDVAIYVAGDWWCEGCAPEEDELYDHSYKPDPIFFPSFSPDELYLGVELEIDKGDKNEFIERVEKEEIYFKKDGSLSEDGVEIVSHPATLSYHREKLGWNDIIEIARLCDFKSHDAGNCGLHIHINRSFLRNGNGVKTEELNITKLLFIHERFFDQILKLSRRTRAQLDRWARSYFSEEEMSIKKVNEVAKSRWQGRYYMINLENSDTIEFRFFRGTLNLVSFFAALEWVDFICRLVVDTSIAQIVKLRWENLVQQVDEKKYPHLKKYLRERDLLPPEQLSLFPSERRC